MKNNILIVTVILLLTSCSNEQDLKNKIEVEELSYTVQLTNAPNDLIYTQEYLFDEGKVISEKFTNYRNLQYNHFSTFQYDSKGRVTKEIRDGKIFREILWNNDTARVYDNQNQFIAEFEFNNSKITSYKLYQNNNAIQIKNLNYGPNDNIISIENEDGIFVEYLNYKTSTINPLSLINSISILRIDYKPHFKNVFRTEKDYPFQGDDYSQPLRFYQYKWTLNPNGLIATMENEKSLIYTRVFEYN